MRVVCCAILMSVWAGTGAFAQGTKDPANFGTTSQTKSTITADPSRPTSVRNVPTNSLPSGMAVQRVYKDGKMYNIAR